MFPPIAKLSDLVDAPLFNFVVQKGCNQTFAGYQPPNYASHFISWFLTNFIAEVGDCEKTNEADKSSSLEDEVRILIKHPPKGLAIKEVRNMFFPYWKAVLSRGSLSRGSMVKIIPACQPSRKDLLSAEASKKGTKKSMGNLGSMVRPQSASNYESRRMLCAVASMSMKVLFKRTWEICGGTLVEVLVRILLESRFVTVPNTCSKLF